MAILCFHFCLLPENLERPSLLPVAIDSSQGFLWTAFDDVLVFLASGFFLFIEFHVLKPIKES